MKKSLKNRKKWLTNKEIDKIINSFLAHIAEYWDVYEKNLPKLARTLMFYNEFMYGIRFLPEDTHLGYVNPKYPLLDDLKKHFGKRLTPEIERIIYMAWPLRSQDWWKGYEEPANPLGNEYNGFQTAREFPEQKRFLDTIRKHPRIKLAIKLMDKLTMERLVEKVIPKTPRLRKKFISTFIKMVSK